MHEILLPSLAGLSVIASGVWYKLYMSKKTLNKGEKIVLKKPIKVGESKVEKTPVALPEKFNKYGTCISCQNGDPNCLHNNLVQDGQCLKCVTCGQCFPQ